MTQPAAVIGFLDPLSGWDPRLAFVMAGAVAVYAIAFRAIRGHMPSPWFDGRFHLPTRADIDRRLVIGSALFGIGWGLGGFCPGPGLVAAASGATGALVFVAAMLVGMYLQHALAKD
ncbi:MAG: YeeE/YedE family protein [Kofleriaceae bacterium]|nr:YeeE/YedE family protein [Kofleriaceae bacterium]